ncbi:MAG: hypothetical protein H7099_15005 [Gemmatimonadaceae bacterium]|nr:hypothetical protein [Gemmatimonadaceae bacterium]
MRNMSALALGLLIMGLGVYGAAAVTPYAFPGAFDAQGATANVVALFVMLTVTEVTTLFAGWVTARLVTDHRAGHAILMAAVGLTSAITVGAVRWSAAPSWYYITSWMLMPCAAALGAKAWERALRRKGQAVTRRIAAT